MDSSDSSFLSPSRCDSATGNRSLNGHSYRASAPRGPISLWGEDSSTLMPLRSIAVRISSLARIALARRTANSMTKASEALYPGIGDVSDSPARTVPVKYFEKARGPLTFHLSLEEKRGGVVVWFCGLPCSGFPVQRDAVYLPAARSASPFKDRFRQTFRDFDLAAAAAACQPDHWVSGVVGDG